MQISIVGDNFIWYTSVIGVLASILYVGSKKISMMKRYSTIELYEYHHVLNITYMMKKNPQFFDQNHDVSISDPDNPRMENLIIPSRMATVKFHDTIHDVYGFIETDFEERGVENKPKVYKHCMMLSVYHNSKMDVSKYFRALGEYRIVQRKLENELELLMVKVMKDARDDRDDMESYNHITTIYKGERDNETERYEKYMSWKKRMSHYVKSLKK